MKTWPTLIIKWPDGIEGRCQHMTWHLAMRYLMLVGPEIASVERLSEEGDLYGRLREA